VCGGRRGLATDTRPHLLDARTGEVRWIRDAPEGEIASWPSGGPVIAGNRVVTRYGKRVHAFDLISGREVRSSTDEAYDDPASADGRVFVPGIGLRALDAESGALLWARSDLGYVDLQPVVSAGFVQVITAAGGDSSVICLDAATGRVAWFGRGVGSSTVRPWSGPGRTAVVDGTRVIGFDPVSWAERWRREARPHMGVGPAAVCGDGTTVYAVTSDDQLFACGARSGALGWTYDLGDVPKYRLSPVSVTAHQGVAHLASRTGLFALGRPGRPA
jgi:outer membrane protein assembly factor BamB